MITYTGIADAADAARSYLLSNGNDLPQHVRDKLAPHTGTGSSPVDLVVNFAEAVYANREAEGMPAEAVEIAAGCAVLAETFGFHGLNEDGRGSKIALVLEGGEVETAPEAKSGFDEPPPVTLPAEA